MRIQFLKSDPMWNNGLPNGFADAGHEVMVSGSLMRATLRDLISDFKPDLIFTMEHTKEYLLRKRKIIKQHVAYLNIPHVYWATEYPGYIHTFSLTIIANGYPYFIK